MMRSLAMPGVLGAALLVMGSPACKKPKLQEKRPNDATAAPAAPALPGLQLEGLGEVRAGQRLDPSRLRADGPDEKKRWGRVDGEERTRFTRAFPISPAFGNRIRPTYIYQREEIWLEGGRVAHVGQGFTVVRQQCTPEMKAALARVTAVIRGCQERGAFVLRQAGRQGMVHYLCERGAMALKVDLRPQVPEFTDERETRAGIVTVSQFAGDDVHEWLRERFERGQSSSASELLDELAPITRHLASCPGAAK